MFPQALDNQSIDVKVQGNGLDEEGFVSLQSNQQADLLDFSPAAPAGNQYGLKSKSGSKPTHTKNATSGNTFTHILSSALSH